MRTLHSLRYSLYVIVHPLDGFWCLKRERRGNLSAAMVILLALTLVLTLSYQFTGYIVFPLINRKNDIVTQILTVAVPFFLWCVSNWCVTSLVDGEGGFTDIVITSAFALVPLILLNLPLILVSRIITGDELALYNVVSAVSVVWTCLLLLLGIMTLHQFTLLKTVVTVLIALLGMVIMLFLFLLFFALVQQMINFIIQIYTELSLR